MNEDAMLRGHGSCRDRLWRLAYRLLYRGLRARWRLWPTTARGAAVAVWWDGRLLVVRTSYRPGLDLPGGGLARGETACRAASRELQEEVGITVPAAALTEAARFASVEGRRRIDDMVYEWQPAAAPTVRVDGREIVWAGWRSPAELAGAVTTPTLRRYLAWRAGQGETRIMAQGDGMIATSGDKPAGG